MTDEKPVHFPVYGHDVGFPIVIARLCMDAPEHAETGTCFAENLDGVTCETCRERLRKPPDWAKEYVKRLLSDARIKRRIKKLLPS